MDKKFLIIIGVLVVAILGLVIYAMIADSNDTYIVKLNGVSYDKQDFETYFKIKYAEEKKKIDAENEQADENTDGQEDNSNKTEPKQVDQESIKDTAWTEYLNAIYLNQIASEKGYVAGTEIEEAIVSQYDSDEVDKDLLNSLNVTKEDYIRVEKIIETSNDFYQNLDKYFPISDSVVEQYISDNSDEMRGIDFRIMQFNIASTEATTDENGEEIPESSNKEEIVEKANSILERAKSGEDFETLAKENADERFVYANSELKAVNGEIESVDVPYLSSELMFSCSDLADPIKALKEVGEYTELITTDTYAAFARLEAVRDTITDETKEALKIELAKYYAKNEITGRTPSIIKNSKMIKSITI